jgi:DNA polymerase
MIDDLTALRLQAEWGADEALGDAPLDRFAPVVPPARPRPAAAMPARTTAEPAAANLAALHAELQAFDGCALRATAMSTVQPDGNPQAGLVLIGDAPGSDDDRSGRAFSGAAGQTLDRVFASIGLDRSAMLLAPLVPWRPPGNRPLSEAEIQTCLPFLRRMLTLVRPRRLVLLGGGPVRALTGNADPIRKLRGHWLEALIRSAATKRDVWSDLLQLRRALTKP